MFKRTNVKILGIIENMTSFTSDDGVKHFIFGKDGGKNIAEKFNVEFLGSISISLKLREGSDAGEPITEIYQNDNISNIFKDIAKKIIKLS
jgi:ATP-binding protein involved in chromosome partitioning